MGDILHALPAVTALRQAHPTWQIDWLVEPKWSALLTAGDAEQCGGIERDTDSPVPLKPVVDKVYFAATKAWRKRPLSSETRGELAELRSTLRAQQYSAVLDVQGSLRSAILGRLAGVRRFIGEAAPREKQARWLFTQRVATHGSHVIEQDIELASAVAGDVLAHVPPMLPFHPAAETRAEELFPEGASPAVLLNPGAGWGAKRWPVERYAAVAQGLIDRGLRVLVNVGPGEEAYAEPIVAATKGQAIALQADLPLLIAVTRRIVLAIAGDTGPLHLACAVGKPVVGIYGPTDPSRNGPFGTRFEVLRSPASVRDHKRRPDPEAGLLTIEPGSVLAAADRVLYPETAQ
ncbi:MAG: glycosyltransferase family 9 protein [Acidobacteriota bacterium]|nr:glycosyltransferase family 9 protein [Acidobacteriota bacterium]